MSDPVWIMSGVTFALSTRGAANEARERTQASEAIAEARAAFFMGVDPHGGRGGNPPGCSAHYENVCLGIATGFQCGSPAWRFCRKRRTAGSPAKPMAMS